MPLRPTAMSDGRGFDSGEAERYWQAHDRYWRRLDRDRDPFALTNVGYAGAPLWLNRHQHKLQARVFGQLLTEVTLDSGSKALDVGCGGGRWSALLSDRGFQVAAIDLQPHLIEANRARYPQIDFSCSSLRDFRSGPVDLTVSVTVFQHIPYSDQRSSIEHLRSLTNDGGFALMLENTRSIGRHMYAHSADRWIELYERAGYQVVRAIPYDFRPILRLAEGLGRRIRRSVAPPGVVPTNRKITPEEQVEEFGRRSGRTKAAELHRWVAVKADALVEPVLLAAKVSTGNEHVGLLFRAV